MDAAQIIGIIILCLTPVYAFFSDAKGWKCHISLWAFTVFSFVLIFHEHIIK